MIYSMTAFARAQEQAEWGTLICEMRSINHRYLEINLHLPELLRPLEMKIREVIKFSVKRGKIECVWRYQQTNRSLSLFSINTALAQELCTSSEKIASFLRQPGSISPTDILRFPGVLEPKESDLSMLEKAVLEVSHTVVKELIHSRGREGEELSQLFDQRLQAMEQEMCKVRERTPSMMSEQKDRLLSRFTEAKIELDSGRLEQEMVILAQRTDVVEEIERIETHINEIKRVLEQGGVVGRRLDFLLQELNREANTMTSKSIDKIVTHAAVEMKVLIEQVREQVQNIE